MAQWDSLHNSRLAQIPPAQRSINKTIISKANHDYYCFWFHYGVGLSSHPYMTLPSSSTCGFHSLSAVTEKSMAGTTWSATWYIYTNVQGITPTMPHILQSRICINQYTRRKQLSQIKVIRGEFKTFHLWSCGQCTENCTSILGELKPVLPQPNLNGQRIEMDTQDQRESIMERRPAWTGEPDDGSIWGTKGNNHFLL